MALSIIRKQINFGDASSGQGTFGSDGTNFYGAVVLVDSNGALITDSSGLPISGNVGITGSVAVTGTFWQATQPISGNVGITGSVAVTGTFWQATQPVSGTVVLGAGAAAIGSVSVSNSVAVTGTFWQATQPVSIANLTIKAASTAPVATDPALVVALSPNSVPVPVTSGLSAAANGLTSSRVVAAATTNVTSLKASAGNIGRLDIYNVAAYTVFLKLYNKASAPTVGTDTPVWTIPIGAGSGYSAEFTRGKSFATGIAYAITKLQADSDTTALVAGDVTGSIDWI